LMKNNNKRGDGPPVPTDKSLYERVKASVYKKMPTHSAYRSGHVVKAYKAAFSKKYGNSRPPYLGKNAKQQRRKAEGLTRWFKEEWRNQRGEVGYSRKGDVYRPTRRVNAKTPKTFGELSPVAIRSAMRTKRVTGRTYF
jgi:hypothetical protein